MGLLNSAFELYDEQNDLLGVEVKITNSEALKVILNDLREKRNYLFKARDIEAVKHFDYVLKYYYGDEDFEKYVINKNNFNP